MVRSKRDLLAYLLPLASCAAAGGTLQVVGVANGMLIGSFVVALVLSRLYPAMKELAGGVTVMQVIIGFSVGESLRDHVGVQSGALMPLIVATLIALAFQWTVAYGFLRTCRWRREDAALAAFPGAMAAVLELTDRNGAATSVIVVHVVRVFVIAIGASLVLSQHTTKVWSFPDSAPGWGAVTLAVFGCLAFGKILSLLEMPAPFLLAAVATTLTMGQAFPQQSLAPPPVAINLAEALLAIAVMIRLRGLDFEEVRGRALSIISVLCVMAAGCVLSAWCIAGVIGGGFDGNLLGIVPGGIESVAVIAVGAQLNVATIMKMHLIRLVAVQVVPTLIIHGARSSRWFRNGSQRKENPN